MCNAQQRREAPLPPPNSLVCVPQGIDPPTAHTIFEVSWVCSNRQRDHPDVSVQPKEAPHATHKTKPHQNRRHRLSFCWSTSTRSAGLGDLTDYGTYGQAKVSYDDANDLFCIESTNPGGTEFYLAPTTKVGPQMTSHVRYGQESCYSLATAYEDTPYLYYIFDGPHILSGTTIEVHFYS